MEKQTTDKAAIMLKKHKYIWKKEWVRQFESAFSILRNFCIVNACLGDRIRILELLGLPTNKSRVKIYYNNRLHIYMDINLSDMEINHAMQQLCPESYNEEISKIYNKIDHKYGAGLALGLRYCPECIKNGYHSALHQSGAGYRCFIHKRESLKYCYSGKYLLGFDFNTGNARSEIRSKILMANVYSKPLDLYTYEDGELPIVWDKSFFPSIEKRLRILDDHVDYVMFRNHDGIGYTDECKSANYILSKSEELKKNRIYHSDFVPDNEATSSLISEAKNYSIKFEEKGIPISLLLDYIVFDFSYRLLMKYSVTKIKVTEFDAFCKKSVSFDDELTVRIVFVYLISRQPWAHDVIDRNFRRFEDRLNRDIENNRKCLNFETNTVCEIYKKFGFATTVFLLKHHLEKCYEVYKAAVEEYHMTDIREDIKIKVPEYAIEKEDSGAVNIYEYL